MPHPLKLRLATGLTLQTIPELQHQFQSVKQQHSRIPPLTFTTKLSVEGSQGRQNFGPIQIKSMIRLPPTGVGLKSSLIAVINSLSYSDFKKAGLFGHELGHAMGLSHQPDLPYGQSIMYNYDDVRDTDRPCSIDCNNINHVYG